MQLSGADFLVHGYMIQMKITFFRWNSLTKMYDANQFAQSGPDIGFWSARRDAFLLVVLVALVFSGMARAQIF